MGWLGGIRSRVSWFDLFMIMWQDREITIKLWDTRWLSYQFIGDGQTVCVYLCVQVYGMRTWNFCCSWMVGEACGCGSRRELRGGRGCDSCSRLVNISEFPMILWPACPKKHTDNYVALCFLAVISSNPNHPFDIFIQILQCCFTDTGAWLPQCQWRNPEEYG